MYLQVCAHQMACQAESFLGLLLDPNTMPALMDTNILAYRPLCSPTQLCDRVALNQTQAQLVTSSRKQIANILQGKDPRLLVIVGPCSIHDIKAGHEYAQRLAAVAKQVSNELMLVMRVYFEKPRTSTGWKGLIMDPHLDKSSDIDTGLELARKFLREVLSLGLPTATELLDPITPQYIADLVCWAAIGARTTESQIHRQMASGLSMPIGFKNAIDGSIQAAIHGIVAARTPQTFLGITRQGMAAAVTTQGNDAAHLILRGGRSGPNYSAQAIAHATRMLEKLALQPRTLVDCSHGNSDKDHLKQSIVMHDLLEQISNGSNSISGIMLESNLQAGNQPFPQPQEHLRYGVSITDACIDWAATESLIQHAQTVMKVRLGQ